MPGQDRSGDRELELQAVRGLRDFRNHGESWLLFFVGGWRGHGWRFWDGAHGPVFLGEEFTETIPAAEGWELPAGMADHRHNLSIGDRLGTE